MNLTGAQMIVECLKQEGVHTAFGIPGGSTLTLYDALSQGTVRHVLCRHEQAAAHAADGFARASGKPGVCIATSGPGATNLVTGLVNAFMDSVPLVAITGQVSRNLIGRDAFQEADMFGISMSATKHNFMVRDVSQIPRIMRQAFHIANTGRKGPVLVDIPKNVFAAAGAFAYPSSVDLPGYRLPPGPDAGDIEPVVLAIRKARRPLILMGGGVIASGASAELNSLSEQARIPVVSTLMGLGGIPCSHPLFVGMIGMHGVYAANRAVASSDLVIALGVRFGDRAAQVLGTFAPKAQIVHVDIDPAEIGKNVRADIPIVGDVKSVVERILEGLKDLDLSQNHTAIWIQQIAKWSRMHPPLQVDSSPGPGLKPQHVIDGIWSAVAGDGIVTTDVGQHQMWAAQLCRAEAPRRFITSGGLGAMGFGFPAAIGAKAAKPDMPVVVIAGDGSFQMNLQEIATMVQHDLPVVICVVNNCCLGMVRQWQDLFYRQNYTAVDLSHSPDFVKIAEAYGIPGRRVTNAAEIRPAMEEALGHKRGFLLEFTVDVTENVFPMTVDGTRVVPKTNTVKRSK